MCTLLHLHHYYDAWEQRSPIVSSISPDFRLYVKSLNGCKAQTFFLWIYKQIRVGLGRQKILTGNNFGGFDITYSLICMHHYMRPWSSCNSKIHPCHKKQFLTVLVSWRSIKEKHSLTGNFISFFLIIFICRYL